MATRRIAQGVGQPWGQWAPAAQKEEGCRWDDVPGGGWSHGQPGEEKIRPARPIHLPLLRPRPKHAVGIGSRQWRPGRGHGCGGGLGRRCWGAGGGEGGVGGSRRGFQGPSMKVLRRSVPLERLSVGGVVGAWACGVGGLCGEGRGVVWGGWLRPAGRDFWEVRAVCGVVWRVEGDRGAGLGGAGGCGRRRGGGGVEGSRRGIRGPSMGVSRRSVPLKRVSGGGAMESGWCGSSGYREWLRWGGA